MNEELLKAVKSLVTDIEEMQHAPGSYWFGPFLDIGESGGSFQWIDLAIMAAKVKELLDGLVIDGSLAAAPLLSADYATEYEGNE